MIARRFAALLMALLTLNLTVIGADSACARHTATAASDVQGTPSVSDAQESESATDVPGAESASKVHGAIEQVAESFSPAMVMAEMPIVLDAPATMGVPSSTDATSRTPCHVPLQSNCCRALLPCSVVFHANDAILPSGSLPSRAVIAPVVALVPPSEIVSPDPPPPKA